jgi:hypothetical protein
MQAEWDDQVYHTNTLDSRKVNQHLDNSIGDVQWLPNISASGEDCIVHSGKFPPLAPKTMSLVWDLISMMNTGNAEQKVYGALSLAELAKNNRNGNTICDESDESPLLCLFRDGSSKGQEEAANALGFSVAERMPIFGVQQEQAIPMFLQIVGP